MDGRDKIKFIMDKFRNIDKLLMDFSDVSIIEDYRNSVRYYVMTSHKESIELPSANVIKNHFKNGDWFAVRPSGTEPKLKYITLQYAIHLMCCRRTLLIRKRG